MTSSNGIHSSPPRSPANPRYSYPPSRGFLSLSAEAPSPMHVHGQGALSNLIKNQASYNIDARDTRKGDEEQGGGDIHGRRSGEMEERRLSGILNTPQMRSIRLIGKSNPRYQWEKYWKTEEELKRMKKPM